MQLTEQLTKFEALNTPVGKAVMLTVGIGVGDVVKASLRQVNVPPLWGGLLLAWGLLNVKQVSQMLGPETAEIVAAGILADTINDEFKIQEQTSNLLAGLFGRRVVSQSPPVLTNQTTVPGNKVLAGSGSSDRYGSIF